jgi:alkaline phosphatase D
VAVFEPSPDALLVAIWAPNAHAASVEAQAGGEVIFTTTVELDAGSGRTAVDIIGLLPSTSYDITVTTRDAVQLGPYRVRTAPSADDPRPVRLAVSADLDPSPEFDSDLLARAAAANPELFVTIGDFPYTDNGPVAVTVDEYRARHAELLTAPKVRAWLASVGVRAIYDDHEFRNNWDASFKAAEPERFAAAMQVWDEFFPLRAIVGDVRYRSWRWGANVECFLLDTRRFRSADAAPDNAQKTMLGATQLAWLIDGVTHSTATFKLIFTTVPLDFGTGNDHWATFTTERQVLFEAVRGIPGILFLSGDQHFFAAHQHAFGIREFQVGPLARGLGTPGPMVPGVLFRDVQYNFGMLDVDADTLTMSGVGADGDVFYQETLTVQQLTPA